MKACIYARTCRSDKSHKQMSLDNQVELCRQLAREHNLTVEHRHVFTDIDLDGALPPSCWAREDEPTRPALAALIVAVEDGEVSRVIVSRVERLSTSSEILNGLLGLCEHYDVNVVALPEQTVNSDDPAEQFAASLFLSRLQLDTETQREAKQQLKAKKREEIERLQQKITRLEAEISEL
jgi:DNA invertase Pin-like site-specific DNA recombinase